MSQYFYIHPDNPQLRLIQQAVLIVQSGGIIAYPTDSSYALGCQLDDKNALEKIRRIRSLTKHHNFTLVCRDLSEIAKYAKIDNADYRLLKKHTPGPYTFILEATREVPRRLLHPKRRTLGIRVPDHAITQALLAELNEPILSSTLILPGNEYAMSDPDDIRDQLEDQLDLVINGGHCGLEPTTVIDMLGDAPAIVREGKGDTSFLI